ncbi:MAG TPA: cellulase family glycosylhydrolase, partial [Dehalococcoidia bacterium]|nr:cellulase family glycosylhydrolase [Dehalococcoidia bacterium]
TSMLAPLLLSCAGGPKVSPPLDKMSSPDYAVQAVLWGQYDTTERDLRLVKDAGFRWVKLMFQWDYIEVKGKGQFEWNESDRLVKLTSDLGLKLLARLDFVPKWARAPGADPKVNGPPAKYQDYFDFVGAVARRYKGKIAAYQIWNEPNLAREWDGKVPNAKEYVDLLKGAYEAIKGADPQAIVITSGLSPTTAPPPTAIPDIEYLRQMYAAGAKDYFDMLGVHAAGYKAAPEADPAEVARDKALTNNDPSPENLKRTYSFRHVEDYRKVMEELGDVEKRVAILEFGWTSDKRAGSPYAWHAVSEEEKADYMVRAYQYAQKNWKPWIGVMSLIYIAAPYWTPNDEQYYWSITDEKGNPRPAYQRLKAMSK